ncbi:MAG: peptidase M14 [Gemmatimonadetes bacterium]|nr:MAG: peptidase M14 [Gemmatimonadota bacterium]PYP63567.1 MAG: peptidase M14 [Gemmatimonadota bacterium]
MKRLLALALVLTARAPDGLTAQQLPLPSPFAGLGFEPGADSMLADWGQITTYLTSVAEASPLVRLDTLGRTTLGRPFLLLTITSPANQRRLEALKRGQRVLADPRGLRFATLDTLRATQPAVVLIDNNIHSTEIASSLMGLTLAYQLATDPALTRLLDSVVVLIVPSMNPDGLDTVVAWYRKYKGTPYEGGPLPWLYHPYVGHDDNRDWFMVTQVETRLVTRVLYHDWFPEVVYDVHQMGSNGPRLFLPPFADPVNPNLDPMLVEATNLVGTTMASALSDSGYTGVAHQVTFDLWWHGGFRSVPARHNMIGILSEAASVRLASPITLTGDALRQPARGVNYPAPWPGGTWRIGDIARYELVAARALVRLAAQERQAFLDRFVTLGQRAVEAGRQGDPFAYLLPPGARDPEARARLATVLLQTGVEVQRAESAFTADGQGYPAGTLVVPMAQPFRAHAKDLLEPQRYPMIEGKPPYDVAGWTLPFTMNVPAVAVRAPFAARLARVDTVVVPPGRIVGTGDAFELDNRSNGESSAIAALLAAGQQVTVADENVLVRGPRARAILSGLATRRGFTARATRAPRGGGVTRRSLPRIAIYQPWTATIDEGWTRWLFEQYGIAFTTVHDSDLRNGKLRDRFEVIVLPDESAERLLHGLDSTRIPVQYAGGMGDTGAGGLSAFVRDGGTLVCLDGASDLAIAQLSLPVTNVLAGEASGPQSSRFYAPGSVFAVTLEGRPSPVTLGLPDSLYVYFQNGGAFEVRSPGRVLARYTANPLRSGYVQHAERIEGKAALVEVPVGRGRVILFGFRSQFRGQTQGTFKLLFNAVLLGGP